MEDEKKAPESEGREDGQPDGNLEGRLAKLESLFAQTQKELETERKASAGKDKKITELTNEKKELQKATLSKDELLALREKELEERERSWEEQQKIERSELEKLRLDNLRREVLKKIKNFPAHLEDRVRGNTVDEIESDARSLMMIWTTERDKVANVGKVTAPPKSGESGQKITAEEVNNMTPEQQKKWAETASDEDYARIYDEMSRIK